MNCDFKSGPSHRAANRIQRGGPKERRVLVFPAGTEIGLEIHAALRGYRNIKLFGAGEAVSNHARFVFSEYHEIPNVRTPAWLHQFIALCDKLRIQYVFPAHDDALIALSAFRDRIPARILTSSDEVCQITRSKSATYRRLAKIVPVPRLYASAAEVEQYPVLVKPDRGQGSLHIYRAENPKQLEVALNQTPDPIICEFLPGEEFTVDCFSSVSQGLLYSCARRRIRTRNGISVHTQTVDLPEVATLASAIAHELDLHGAWFFQLKRSVDNVLTLLEVAPRIAGAMAAHRVSGVNFPLLTILDAEGQNVQILNNPGQIQLDRALCNRYQKVLSFDCLYLDLEDTLLREGVLDEDVMRLVCRCLNEDIRLVLLATENYTSMPIVNRIIAFFDEVVHVEPDQPRSDCVQEASAIYVDNSFRRRLEVSRSKNIPTFDTSMIELLYSSTHSRAEPGDAA
jgi:hypothetical protein